MARSGKRNNTPNVRPVIRAELSDKNRALRWVLIIGFSCIALISLIIGLRAALVTEPGWEMVESASTESNCSGDFVFSYCYGRTQEDPSTEKKQLTLLYSELSESAYQIFYEGLAPIQENLNQPVTVDPALYHALEQIQQSGNRTLYLAPVYAEYNPIFLSANEGEAMDYDPGQNPELAAYVGELAAFANDPSMINLELLENNQVCLRISNGYASYAADNEITEFLDFGWMVNAFIVDYLAEELADAGYTNGFISSYDGFTRNLDSRGEQFSLNLFDRESTNIYLAGTMQYTKPISIVFLRDFPMSQRDSFHYYAFTNGRIVSTYLDAVDGMSKCAVDSLTSYSYDAGCAQILLQQIPVFVADTWNAAAVEALTQAGVYSVWFEGTSLYCNDRDLSIQLDPESGMDYKLIYTD